MTQRPPNPISITPAPLNKLVGRRQYDLPTIIEVMRRVWEASVVDGFEFQHLAEWAAEGPPRDDDDTHRRLASWEKCPKYSTDRVATVLQAEGLPILSVHANRDVGICLCSDQPEDIIRGKRLISEAFSLAEQVGAEVCVFHLWDTWGEKFDPAFLREVLREIASRYPGAKAAVENVPTHLPGWTPFELVMTFEWITLDLRWAALYDELDRFESLRDRIANVHLRAQLEGDKWIIPADWFPRGEKSFGFYDALDTIRNEWKCPAILTVEPGVPRDATWDDLVTAMASLQRENRRLSEL
jgi:hypothetical protein